MAEENFFDTVENYWHPDDAKKKERRVVSELGLMQRCLSDNAYFAHEENVLLGMLCDLERPDFRMRAAKTIRKIRELRTDVEGLRAFVPPKSTGRPPPRTTGSSLTRPSKTHRTCTSLR